MFPVSAEFLDSSNRIFHPSFFGQRLIIAFALVVRNLVKDWKNPVRDTEEYRDSILEILSDARVVAPVIQMADLHSAIRQRSYFYVFAHQTTNGDYPQVS